MIELDTIYTVVGVIILFGILVYTFKTFKKGEIYKC